MSKNYYEVLQVSESVTDTELKKAYKNLVKKYHPDNNTNDKNAEIRFKEISEAYDILKDPEKRKKYDMELHEFFKRNSNSVTNDNKNEYTSQNNDSTPNENTDKYTSQDYKSTTKKTNQYSFDVFNSVFQDEIKRYNEERNDYIKFLNEMEPKFNEYNRTLRKEKNTVMNLSWSLSFEGFYYRKLKVEKSLKELKENVEAFDEFLIFFKEYQKKLDKYGFSFNDMGKYLDPSQRGDISASFYSNLKNQIKDELQTIERQIKAYDEYMQFLDKMEAEFNYYGITIKKIKERYKGKRGKISVKQIYDEQRDIRLELSEMKIRAEAFDRFSKFYQDVCQDIQTLYNKKLINFDEYLDPKNRVSFKPEVFVNKQIEINNVIIILKKERNEKLRIFREELKKRNLDINEYLLKRNTNQFTISMVNIEKILKSMKIIDEINIILFPFGLTFEEFLKLKGLLLIDLEYEQLLAIKGVIKDYINNKKEVNFQDIDIINLEEYNESSSLKV